MKITGEPEQLILENHHQSIVGSKLGYLEIKTDSNGRQKCGSNLKEQKRHCCSKHNI